MKRKDLMKAYNIECCADEIRNYAEDVIRFVKSKARKSEAHEVERGIFSLILSIGLGAMKLYFAECGTGNCGKTVLAADGRLLPRSKGLFERAYFCIFGKFNVPRTRYRARSGDSIFPLDSEVNLPERCYSYFLQEICNCLEVEQTFETSSNFLEDYFELQAAESVLIDLAQDAAPDYDDYYKSRAVPATETEGEIQVVSFDGKGVPMIKKEAAKLKGRLGRGEKRQKKKEALVGVSYTIDPNIRSAEALAESLIQPEIARRRREKENGNTPFMAKNIRRFATLERSKEEAFIVLREDIQRRDPSKKRPLAVLLDGARCLRRLAGKVFESWPNTVYILDIIHVIEYLWSIANALFGENHPSGRAWVHVKFTAILRGRVGYVIGGFRQLLIKRKKLSNTSRTAIEKAITYFSNHKDMMQYDQYLAAGMPVATSIVESTCGLVKSRMEGSGKRWGIPGAEAILTLISLKRSNDNDLIDFVKFRAAHEKKRLYGARPKFAEVSGYKKAA